MPSNKKRTLGLLTLLGAAVAPLNADASELPMPMRAESLPDDTVLRTKGHNGYDCGPTTPANQRNCQLDIVARRWDSISSSWTWERPPGDQLPFPEQNTVIFGLDLHAPVDGVVVSCWMNMPDDQYPDDDVRCPGGGEDEDTDHMCARRGNHIHILTEEGELVGLNHMEAGSIPPELCPNTGTYLYTDDPNTCHFYDAARVDTPIPVQRGDFLGRVGTSGNSGSPHIHMQVSEAYENSNGDICRGDSLPWEFSESWLASFDDFTQITSGDWDPLEAEDLPVDGVSAFAIWPDPIGPRTDKVTLASGTSPSIASTSAGGVVAFRTSAGKLGVRAYSPDSSGSFLLGTQRTEGNVGDVAIAKIGESSRHAVAAVVNGSGKLLLLPYYVSTTRQLTRGNSETGDDASAVAAARAPNHTGVITARINGSGTLTVQDASVSVSGTTLTPTLRGSDTSNASVQNIAIDRVVSGRGLTQIFGAAFQGAVTAERRGDNRLAIRSWSVTSGGTVTLTDSELPSLLGFPLYVDDVDVTVTGSSWREIAVVSARIRNTDDLVVLTYQISSSGALTLIDMEFPEGEYAHIVASAPAGEGDVLLGLAADDDTLSELAFSVGSDADPTGTGEIRQTGARRYGAISDVDVAARAGQGDAVFAVRDGQGDISLIRHRVTFSSSQ